VRGARRAAAHLASYPPGAGQSKEPANVAVPLLLAFGMYLARGSKIQTKPSLSCTDACGPGWDRTSDLPRVKLRRSQNRAVCAGQAGPTGLILRAQSTRYDGRGGYGADEIEPVIRGHGRVA
jgi:hypothetical protein